MATGREGRKLGDGRGRAIVIARIQILLDCLRAIGPGGAGRKRWRRRLPALPKGSPIAKTEIREVPNGAETIFSHYR
jgi:hypothetical protein